jgi:acetyl-CoA C-acetyltransferase
VLQAALAQVPQLDVSKIDDLLLGCGSPAGESGYNLARVVAVMAGLDEVPGTTVNRYCSSSLQTTRMAFHAITAGEGEVFISASVETIKSIQQGNCR